MNEHRLLIENQRRDDKRIETNICSESYSIRMAPVRTKDAMISGLKLASQSERLARLCRVRTKDAMISGLKLDV